MQVTSFPFKIVIHDDVSTDATRAVIDAYASRYAQIIRTVYQTENQYSQGRTTPIIARLVAAGQDSCNHAPFA